MRGRASGSRFYAAVAVGTLAVIAFVLATKREPRAKAEEGPTSATADFCAPGLEPLRDGCFAAAARGARGAPVIVYLHGRYGPQQVAEEATRQSTVARVATAKGFSVLALRGQQGECSQREIADYWCWPSNEKNASDAQAFVARWKGTLDEVDKRAGSGPRYVLGFSNGGYFAAIVASRALVPLDAVAIAHGGPVEPMRESRTMPPMLLVTADDDPSDDEMHRLDAILAREKWPRALVSREGGHGLPDWDVEMATTFFARTRSEKMPLSPPMQVRARRAIPAQHAKDGGEEDASATPPAIDAAEAPVEGAAPADSAP